MRSTLNLNDYIALFEKTGDRKVTLNNIKENFDELICSYEDLWNIFIVMKNEEETASLCEMDLSKGITSITELKELCIFLTDQKRNEEYQRLLTSKLIKEPDTQEDYQLHLQIVTGELHDNLKKRAQTLTKPNNIDVLSQIKLEESADFCTSEDLSQAIKNINQFADVAEFLSDSQKEEHYQRLLTDRKITEPSSIEDYRLHLKITVEKTRQNLIKRTTEHFDDLIKSEIDLLSLLANMSSEESKSFCDANQQKLLKIITKLDHLNLITGFLSEKLSAELSQHIKNSQQLKTPESIIKELKETLETPIKDLVAELTNTPEPAIEELIETPQTQTLDSVENEEIPESEIEELIKTPETPTLDSVENEEITETVNEELIETPETPTQNSVENEEITVPAIEELIETTETLTQDSVENEKIPASAIEELIKTTETPTQDSVENEEITETVIEELIETTETPTQDSVENEEITETVIEELIETTETLTQDSVENEEITESVIEELIETTETLTQDSVENEDEETHKPAIENLKETSVPSVQKESKKASVIENLIEAITTYKQQREKVTAEYYHQWLPHFFQKSRTNKLASTEMLLEALTAIKEGKSASNIDLQKYQDVIRNGELGRTLRTPIKEGKLDALFGKKITTVSEFIKELEDSVKEKNSPKRIV